MSSLRNVSELSPAIPTESLLTNFGSCDVEPVEEVGETAMGHRFEERGGEVWTRNARSWRPFREPHHRLHVNIDSRPTGRDVGFGDGRALAVGGSPRGLV